MGNYISSSDLESRLGSARLSGLCGATGDALSALLSGVIARAEAVVDAYASVRYLTPLKSSELVSEWTLRVAEYELYKRAPGDSVPAKIKDSYQDALAQLKSLAAGELDVASDPAQEKSSPSGSSLSVRNPAPSNFDGFNMGVF